VQTRDKSGKSLKTVLTRSESKRQDALFMMAVTKREIAEAQRSIPVQVERARRYGATWEEIGRHLGVTAQTAHRVYSPNAKPRTSEAAARRRVRAVARDEKQGRLSV
jgi:hypothetical protein